MAAHAVRIVLPPHDDSSSPRHRAIARCRFARMRLPMDESMLPQRRRFLQGCIVVAAAPVALALPCRAGAAPAPVSRQAFPQSVASGDPRPDRVVLWTRVDAADGQDVGVWLEVADDPAFEHVRVRRELTATAASDHCLRVRVEGLAPGRDYHYRFLRGSGAQALSSPVGRTRTATAPEARAALRFAFVSCQDRARWYNALLPLLDQDLDFILHLGDFIYETVGDPVGGEARRIRLEDTAGALRLQTGSDEALAARSLSNYRQLHREYRNDPVLQRLLERAPLVAVWDDHEFSDDCWQDHATYHDGRIDEGDRQRRLASEQAYFEYMPVDVDVGIASGGGALGVDPAQLFPRARLWRELRFGRDVQLLLLDYRSARPDHPIPEDAFPGALVYDAQALARLVPLTGLDPAKVDRLLLPYLDLREPAHAPLRKPLLRALRKGYADAGLGPGQARSRADAATAGPIAVHVARAVLEKYNAAVPGFMRVRLPSPDADHPRGLPWLALGKHDLFGEMGSRYFVVREAYDLLLALRAADGQPVPSALGEAQQAWLDGLVAQPAPRWRLLGSSVAMVPMVLDLGDPALDAPAAMRRAFYLNVDQWDGFADQRDALVERLDAAGGALVFSGDIHSAFAAALGRHTAEFTTPAVSSTPLREIALHAARRDPATAEAGRRLADGLERLLQASEPRMLHANAGVHGFGLVDIAGDDARVSLFELPSGLAASSLYDTPAQVARSGRWIRFAMRAGDKRPRPA